MSTHQRNTILIIEDAEVYQLMLSTTMQNAGFETEICDDGMKAMIRTNQHMEHIRAILLDIYMPEIDGISMLGHLRSKYPEIPVYVISGTEDEDDKHSVLGLDAAQFIAKPLTPTALAGLIDSIKQV